MRGTLRRAIALQLGLLIGATVLVTALVIRFVSLPAGLVAGLVVGLLGTALAASRLSEPIRRLAQAARAFSEGSVDRLPARHGAGDEVEAITAAMEGLGEAAREREEAHDREARQLRRILETMIEGVLVIGPEGRITLDNAAMRHLVPALGSLEGRTPLEALRNAEFDAAVRTVLAGGPAPVLDLVVGTRRSFRVSLAPLQVDEGVAVVAVFHDVSRLRELENVRRDFVANVSHELRTPLSAIRGYVETLRDGDVAPDDRARFLETVSRHTERLSTLIEDLLELSRLESPETRLDVHPVSLESVARKSIQLVEGAATSRGVSLTQEIAPDLPSVIADPRSLEQVFVNLLDNAIKYTGSGGRVGVSAQGEPGWVRVSVTDSGVGIPATDLPRLFERFFRVDRGRSREQGGTGLGLAIVKHLVTLQGGDVGVESESGRGSTFWFTLRTTADAGRA